MAKYPDIIEHDKASRMSIPQKHLLYVFALICLLVATVYGSTLTSGFVWDDTDIIVNNPLLEQLTNIPRFFLMEDTIDEPSGFYRPLTYVSFALDRAIWGMNPAGFHLTNIVLQICTVFLFFTVVLALFENERLAFIATLIFALHPVAGETVNFISGGRNTLLAACGTLLAFYFHIRKRHIPALCCFTAAIFSKEFALLLPAVLLVHDLQRQRQFRVRRYAPYLVPIAGYLALRSLAVQKANFLSEINLSDSMIAPYLILRYALNMIYPFQLKLLYQINITVFTAVVSLLAVIAALIVMYCFRKDDKVVFSLSWFLIFLIPVINIIPLNSSIIIADRYSYFSLMGFAIFLASILCKADWRVGAPAVILLCSAYAFVDYTNNGFWKNDIAFFTRMTLDAPESFIGFKNVGMSYYKTGDTDRAVRSLEIADSKSDIRPRYLIGNAYIYWKENLPDKATKALNRVIDENPSNPEPYLLLMIINEQYGDSVSARSYRDKLLDLLPGQKIEDIIANRAIDLCRLGEQFLARKHYAEAETYLWQALRIVPDHVPALIDMGSLRSEQGNPADAIQYLSKALALEPSNATARYNLAMVHKMRGKPF